MHRSAHLVTSRSASHPWDRPEESTEIPHIAHPAGLTPHPQIPNCFKTEAEVSPRKRGTDTVLVNQLGRIQDMFKPQLSKFRNLRMLMAGYHQYIPDEWAPKNELAKKIFKAHSKEMRDRGFCSKLRYVGIGMSVYTLTYPESILAAHECLRL